MRYRLPQVQPTKAELIILTGGVKEDKPQLELAAGELLEGENYQEIDGVFHGYTSVAGYEIYDGSPLASSVDLITLSDGGNDTRTKLLIESNGDVVVEDSSVNEITLIDSGVLVDTDPSHHRFFESSFYFAGSESFTTSGEGTTLDLEDGNFNIDLRFEMAALTAGSQVLLSKDDSYRVYINSSGGLFLQYSTDGATWTDTFTTGVTIVAGEQNHIAFTRYEETIRCFINGEEEVVTYDAQTDTIFTNTNPMVVGEGCMGWVEEIRICDTCRWNIPFEVPASEYTSTTYNETYIDDTDREAARALIGELPGDDSTRMVAEVGDDLYAIRDLGSDAFMYKATPTGWSTAIGGFVLANDGVYDHVVGQFDLLTGLQREKVLFFTNGQNKPCYYNGTDLVDIDDAALPEQTDGAFATHVGYFKNRLWLAYPDGRLWYSKVGDPTDYDTATSGAGEVYIGDEITGMVEAPGDTLIVFCRNSTRMISALSDDRDASAVSTQAFYKFKNESISSRSGALPSTSQRMLGDIYYLDDRGLSALSTTGEFGDFSASSLSKNAQSTLMKNKLLTTCSVVNRQFNQYRLFFSDFTGMIFTFDVEKKIKGITKIKYNHSVECVDESEDADGYVQTYFGSSDGGVYKMDSGTSFNGEVIKTKLATSFFSYKTPTNWKRFKKIILEAQAEKGVTFTGKSEYNYRHSNMPKAETGDYISSGTGGIWGTSVWGIFDYGSTEVENPTLYLTGYGVNMSVLIITEEKFYQPHTLNDMIVEYSLNARKM